MPEKSNEELKQMARDWKKSKIRTISNSLKNFKNAEVQFAYDKDGKIYSVMANLEGQPLVLTLKISQKRMEMMLTDKNGSLLEHVYQEGNVMNFTKNY
ncbi:MAG: hypothetical protein WCT31_03075 [Candidatus Micrarchaeia archaeon]